MALIHLENKNPTAIEKELWLLKHYYLIDQEFTGDTGTITYACIRNIDEVPFAPFPETLDVEQSYIDYTDTIIFERMGQTVKVEDYLGMELLYLLVKRTEELGWTLSWPIDSSFYKHPDAVNEKEELT